MHFVHRLLRHLFHLLQPAPRPCKFNRNNGKTRGQRQHSTILKDL